MLTSNLWSGEIRPPETSCMSNITSDKEIVLNITVV
jgi:hypothetical protein